MCDRLGGKHIILWDESTQAKDVFPGFELFFTEGPAGVSHACDLHHPENRRMADTELH